MAAAGDAGSAGSAGAVDTRPIDKDIAMFKEIEKKLTAMGTSSPSFLEFQRNVSVFLDTALKVKHALQSCTRSVVVNGVSVPSAMHGEGAYLFNNIWYICPTPPNMIKFREMSGLRYQYEKLKQDIIKSPILHLVLPISTSNTARGVRVATASAHPAPLGISRASVRLPSAAASAGGGGGADAAAPFVPKAAFVATVRHVDDLQARLRQRDEEIARLRELLRESARREIAAHNERNAQAAAAAAPAPANRGNAANNDPRAPNARRRRNTRRSRK
jgi:hypothetical protein